MKTNKQSRENDGEKQVSHFECIIDLCSKEPITFTNGGDGHTNWWELGTNTKTSTW